MVSSKHCPIKDVDVLMYRKTLPYIVRLMEHIEIQNAFEQAAYKDAELNKPKK